MLSIDRIISKQVDGYGLALFRITFFSVMINEVLALFRFRHLIYDKIPFSTVSEITYTLPMIIWLAVLVLLVAGLFTRVAAILNYVFVLVYLSTSSSYEYHVYYIYIGVAFLSIFLPIGRAISLDNLREKIKYSTVGEFYAPSIKVSQYSYFIISYIFIAWLYFDSVLWKLGAQLWTDGLGVWYPASLPFAVKNATTMLMNQEWLVKIVCYIIIIHQFVIIFLINNKKSRAGLFLLGMIFHIGIFVVYPIPNFAMALMALYTLIIPHAWIKKFEFPKVKNKLNVFYDGECPLCARTIIVIKHFDIFDAIKFVPVQVAYNSFACLKSYNYDELLLDLYSENNGKMNNGLDTYIAIFKKMYVFYVIGLFLQLPGVYHVGKKCYQFIASNRETERCDADSCSISGNAPAKPPVTLFKAYPKNYLLDKVAKYFYIVMTISLILVASRSGIVKQELSKFGYYDTYVGKINVAATDKVVTLLKPIVGLNHRGLFLDAHFEGYDRIVSVYHISSDGSEVILPIINENGRPEHYLTGGTWAKWTFRGGDLRRERSNLEVSLRDFTAFWMGKNNINFIGSKFIIKVKKIDLEMLWEKDKLKKNMAQRWEDAGYFVWDNRSDIIWKLDL